MVEKQGRINRIFRQFDPLVELAESRPATEERRLLEWQQMHDRTIARSHERA